MTATRKIKIIDNNKTSESFDYTYKYFDSNRCTFHIYYYKKLTFL